MDEELKAYLDEMKSALAAHVTRECEQVETKLLHAFHGWARSMEIRVRGVSGVAMGFEERLALAEERISEVERKQAS